MALQVTINGKKCTAEKDEYILSVCQKNGVFVPTFCHHEGLPGLGTCRLCIVEVNEGSGSKVVVSCIYPINKDCEVFTESTKIQNIRKTILSMLKARAPANEMIQNLCKMYGVSECFTAQSGKNIESCILCGLCVEACARLGTGAISTVNRGIAKEISTPYGDPSFDCVGCGSCAAICKANAIECITTEKGKDVERRIWGRKFKLIRCTDCKKPFATAEEYERARCIAADPDAYNMGVIPPQTTPPLCDVCRKKKSADILAEAFGERH
jgi:NADH dehydrogenase/NADH:ubiquinone oxidoreductase subunit G